MRKTSLGNPSIHVAKGKPSILKTAKQPLLHYITSLLGEFMQFGL